MTSGTRKAYHDISLQLEYKQPLTYGWDPYEAWKEAKVGKKLRRASRNKVAYYLACTSLVIRNCKIEVIEESQEMQPHIRSHRPHIRNHINAHISDAGRTTFPTGIGPNFPGKWDHMIRGNHPHMVRIALRWRTSDFPVTRRWASDDVKTAPQSYVLKHIAFHEEVNFLGYLGKPDIRNFFLISGEIRNSKNAPTHSESSAPQS